MPAVSPWCSWNLAKSFSRQGGQVSRQRRSGRAVVKGARSLLNQLQVVVRVQLPLVVTEEPKMPGQLLAVVEDLQVSHGQLHLDS